MLRLCVASGRSHRELVLVDQSPEVGWVLSLVSPFDHWQFVHRSLDDRTKVGLYSVGEKRSPAELILISLVRDI